MSKANLSLLHPCVLEIKCEPDNDTGKVLGKFVHMYENGKVLDSILGFYDKITLSKDGKRLYGLQLESGGILKRGSGA